MTTFTFNELLTGDMPIGQPVAHTIVCVLDESLAPVAVGVPGARCAGGDGLARG